MALALGVRANDRVYVGDIAVDVLETLDFVWAKLEVGGKVYEITDKQSVEILPQVFVSCGKPDERFIKKQRAIASAMPNAGTLLPRLIFEAPREITILRAELYERARAPV